MPKVQPINASYVGDATGLSVSEMPSTTALGGAQLAPDRCTESAQRSRSRKYRMDRSRFASKFASRTTAMPKRASSSDERGGSSTPPVEGKLPSDRGNDVSPWTETSSSAPELPFIDRQHLSDS